MRLFAALRLSDAVRDHLGAALAPFTAAPDARRLLRWSPPEQWHVTTAFYGEVPRGLQPALTDALGEAAAAGAAMDLHLSGAGAFSGRTVWMGVGGPASSTAALRSLMSASAAVGRDLGLGAAGAVRARAAERDDERPPRPHVTVLRARPGAEVAHIVHALSVYRSPAWRPTALTLFLSEPGAGKGGRALYTPLAEMPLGEADPA